MREINRQLLDRNRELMEEVEIKAEVVRGLEEKVNG